MKKIPEGYKETELGVIPQEWEVSKLREIVEICYGKSQKTVEDVNGVYKILGTGGEIGRTNSFLWDKPSVLIGRKGTINKPMYIEEPFWTVDTLFFTKVKENSFAKWLYYYLNKIDLAKFNEASGVPSLNTTTLNNINIIVPSLPEQQKIAEILSSVDDHIEKLDETISEYELLKKGMMKKLLTEGIGHTEFKDTELGRIPKVWEVRKLENCANFVSNGFVGTASPYYSEDKEDNYYLMGNNVRENYIDKRTLVRISKEFVQKYPKTKVYEYDMLTVQSGHIGTSCIITKEFDGANCHAVIITRFIKDLIDPNFQAYYLNSSIGKRRLKSIFVGTTIKHINTKDLKTFLLAVPLLSEQQKIASILSSIDERIDLYKSEKEDFMQVKKGLMEKLLTGKIRV